jgi:hypothetical protein
MTYDLILRGGRVVDPSQNIDGIMDVAFTDGSCVNPRWTSTARAGWGYADYAADAGQSKLDLSPCAYELIDAFIAETKAVPAATRDHLKRVLNPGGA